MACLNVPSAERQLSTPPRAEKMKEHDIEIEDVECGEIKSAEGGLEDEDRYTLSPNHGRSEDEIRYAKKTNSKLRTMLFDRNLSTCGTREELIFRLANSTTDYEALSTAELTSILKRRKVKAHATGSRVIKIERLKVNDSLCHDTGNAVEQVLWSNALYRQGVVDGSLEAQEHVLSKLKARYWSTNPARLSATLRKRNLPSSGSKEELISRLGEDDQTAFEAEIEPFRIELDIRRQKLEAEIGFEVENVEKTYGYGSVEVDF